MHRSRSPLWPLCRVLLEAIANVDGLLVVQLHFLEKMSVTYNTKVKLRAQKESIELKYLFLLGICASGMIVVEVGTAKKIMKRRLK